MTTIEKLFVQISESNKRIIEKIKNEAQLFDQHLASICILEGISPPSWLLSSSFPSASSHPTELNKEDLISGLLLPPSLPPNPYSTAHYTLYQNHIVTNAGDNNDNVDNKHKGLTSDSYTEVGASNNATYRGDRLSVLLPFQNDDRTRPGDFICVPELDPSITSPPDCGNDARMVFNCASDRGQLAVAELDPSVTAPRDCGDDERMLDNFPGVGQSFVAELNPSVTSPLGCGDHARTMDTWAGIGQPFVSDLDHSVTSPSGCGDARMLDCCADHGQPFVAQLDQSVTSPPGCRDARILDNFGDHGQSFVAELDHCVMSPSGCGDARMLDSCADHDDARTMDTCAGLGQPFVADLDHSVTSPSGCGDARMLDSCADHGQPFVAQLDPSVTSPPGCRDARMLDNFGDHGQAFVAELDHCVMSPSGYGYARMLDNSQSLVKIQRSKARQRYLQLRNSAKASKLKPHDDCKNGDACTSRGMGSGINSLQYDHDDELELAKPVDTINGGCNEEEAKIGACGSKDKNSDSNNGRTIGSSSSIQQTSFAKEDGVKCVKDLIEQSNYFNEISELANHFVLYNENCMPEEGIVVDCKGNEMNGIICSDRIRGSRSSISDTRTLKEALQIGNSSCVAEELKEFLDKSPAKHPSPVSTLLELVKSSPLISNESCGSRKAKTRGKQMKESGSNTFAGRITRSRRSRQQPNRVNKCLYQDNSCGNEKELKQLSNHVHDITELDKPLDIAYASSRVEEEVRECQNIGVGSDAYSYRITSSSSAEKLNNVNVFSKGEDSSDIVKDGDAILADSLGKSSQQPQLSSLVQGAGVNIQVLSSTQRNVPPCTESIIHETQIDGDGLVEVHPSANLSNSGGARCAMEVLEPRPPSECAMVVNPKQLDFGDVENNLFESYDPALVNEEEDTEKPLSSLPLSTDVLEKATSSVGYHEQPNLSIQKPMLKEQLFSGKSCKDCSEGHMQGGAVLVDESTISSVLQKIGTFISQNQEADSYFMGSWPQHKRIKIGGHATISLSATSSLKKGDSKQLFVVKSPIEDIPQNTEHKKIEESEVSSSTLQVDEVKISMERMSRSCSTAFPLILERQQASPVANSKRLAAGVFQGCLSEKAEVADPAAVVFDVLEQDYAEENQVTREHTAEENNVLFQLENELELEDAEVLNHTEDSMQEDKYHFEGKDILSFCSSGSPFSQPVIHNNQNMPEFEGFVIGTDDKRPCTNDKENYFENFDLPPTELGCASVAERLCKSTCVHTPLSHFSATYPWHEALNLYQSIPNGLLEGMEMRSTLNMDGDGSKRLCANYSFLDEGINHDLHGRSHSISLPLSNSQSSWNITKPCMSPIGKFWDGIPPKFGSSGKRVSSIPELPCISEENETTDGLPDRLLEGVDQELGISSVKRDPLADIRKQSNPLTSVYEAETHDDRGSLATVNTEVSYSGTCDRATMKLGNKNSNKRRFTTKAKENHNISLGGDGIKRGNRSLHSRSSRPKLSGKAGLTKGGQSLLEKESKLKNIVSNITSFIPLVQQKQADAVITGKRDIKVKALEAAEAAKRNAQKKENERKMRKEAIKLERAKMEEQNLRQLELEKKKKEDEKKKKEADMAARKRRREEEEKKKEKERKRMRVEEAKRHQLAHEKKLLAEKEEKEVKLKALNEKAHERKESKAKLGKYEKLEKTKGDNYLETVPQNEPVSNKVSTIDIINASAIPQDRDTSSDCGDNLKVMGSIRIASESNSLVSSITREQSYEISPYKGSDDEDEDEDNEIRKSKFIPSWASKSHLAPAVLSQQRIDPESVFPPESFCSISKVLLPRRLQQK